MFALFVCLVLGGLSSSGVPSMIGTHIIFIAATFCAIVGVVTSEIIFHQSRPVIVLSGILTLLVAGGTLFALDRYLQKQRDQLDVLLTPANPKPPKAPSIQHLPKKQAENNVSQGGKQNQQTVIQGSTVTQQSKGDCSPNQIGVTNTNNCGPQLPPARVLSPEKLISLCDELKHAIGSVQIVWFTEDDAEEVSNLHKQLASAFRCATWSVVYPQEMGNPNSIMATTNQGAKRLGGKSLVCAAKEESDETASKAVIALGNAGLTCLQDSDFYMSYGYAALMANAKPTLVILISKRMPK
jgi:hypothetical protein